MIARRRMQYEWNLEKECYKISVFVYLCLVIRGDDSGLNRDEGANPLMPAGSKNSLTN